ncbi:hypothetical protein QLL95_gp0967 [Cotonvirus japonicus]|uniref:Uncharacterized protein n=1 Tax=Cotonvirus japonicus TaxID=2811091 RepID=A0ABM7NSR1_9VIRU|nr:hypothetical protein QLL95_gp0967 [Cotonvirus japonicus]BCS83156.1 hypothetical protein [Cotonvirus japonicus]
MNPPIVNPTVVKKRSSPGTPFITNSAKQIYANKMREQEEEEVTESESETDIKKDTRRDGDRRPPKDGFRKDGFRKDTNKPKENIPYQFSPTYMKPTPVDKTLKLELYAPQQQQQQPERPFGIYEIPTIEIPGVPKRFSQAAYQNLFAPTQAVAYSKNLVSTPIQNVYNINLPNPASGGHGYTNIVYENVLPGKDGKFTSTTIGERRQMYDYIRQILIKINDGEDISIDSDGHNNLMSYIKFMELNPNYYSPLFNNPYRGLPFGLLVYRSCFPIRFDAVSQGIVCAKNSIGLNIRLYALSCAEYFSYRFRQVIYKEYDVWRELSFYEYVRENIIKRKQSPNFTLLYAFFLSPNKRIDYFSLKKGRLTQKELLSQEYKKFMETHALISQVKPSDEIIRPMSLPDAARRVIAKLPDEMDPGLQAYSGNILILVTEAPHHNLYQWASRTYDTDGIVRRMTSAGVHDERIWYDVLFQIVSALYVMQIHGIYIRDMTIEDNIYIKDIQSYGKASGYWKYVIDGISYYIPNYGYLVMVDSNFKDIIPDSRTIGNCKREYKIYTSDICGKRYKMSSVRNKVFENYRRIINTNAFTKEHTQSGVMRPPDSIMNFINSMMSDPEKNLGVIIQRYFRRFMNNRIGTLLRKDTEVPNIREITGPLKNGELVAEVIDSDIYRWSMVVKTLDDGLIEIITRENSKCDDFMTRTVRIETLKQYATHENIEQNIDFDVNLSENELLETYTISLDSE